MSTTGYTQGEKPGGGKATPFMAQYLAVKEQHPDKLVLFRMGDFYEVFFDDARTASRVLGITLTARDSKSANPTPMAGIPHHALGEYLPKLIGAGLRIAICDQVEDPAKAKGLVRREVVRVVTSGTLTEDHLLEPGRNNYLLALDAQHGGHVLAYLDFSTGEVYAREVQGGRIVDILGALAPRELLTSRSFARSTSAADIQACLDVQTTLLDDWNFAEKSGRDRLLRVYGVHSTEAFGINADSPLLRPLGALLHYLEQTQMTSHLHLRRVQTVQGGQSMVLDRQTSRNLEIFQNQHDGGPKGTLFACLNETATPMGSRRLAMWLAHPLLVRAQLEERHELVAAFMASPSLQAWTQTLEKLKDLERPLGRIRAGRFSARDLKSVASSLLLVPALNAHLESDPRLTARRVPELSELARNVHGTLLDELPPGIHEGGMIAPGVDAELDELRGMRDHGKEYLHQLQERLKVELDLPGLKVGSNGVFGYYIEVPKAQSRRVPDHFARKQTLVNAERYIIPELKEFENKIFSAQDGISAIELRWIGKLREEILAQGEAIMDCARALSELDCLSTFARAALRHGYTRPQLVDEPTLQLRGSRHPVVERLLGPGEFTPNDLELRHDGARIILLTGPNMAGKSTFIRQVGLIQIMAQTGSFVPASEARLSLADRVFTRVGAGDDLGSGRSTFMVEMNETANILHNATPRSLVILDEVGRGTSTLDGLSLARAITEELHNQPRLQPLCLFATHYHELTALAETCPHLRNFQLAVEEIDKRIIFLHHIVPGGADKSYGIHVAALAGLPEHVIRRARQLLDELEHGLGSPVSSPAPAPHLQADPPPLFTFEPAPDRALRDKLKAIKPDEITPLQALIYLKELKDSLDP